MGLFNAECKSKARLDGKTAIVTGANTGIGKCTAQDLYTRGAHVILACRNLQKADAAVAEIKEACKGLQNVGTLRTTQLDVGSLRSVRESAARLLNEEERIDLLINNAGVFMGYEPKTEDGFETHMGTNHLGPFLFTLLLLPKICQSTPARIVNVASGLHEFPNDRIDLKDLNFDKKKYTHSKAYQQSKLANILFAKELDRKLKERGITGVTTYSLHPGLIKTDIFRNEKEASCGLKFFSAMTSWAHKTPIQGAQTSIYCAVHEACADQSGLYYEECAEKKPSKYARSEEDAKGLWELSWKLVGLDDGYDPFGSTRL